MQEQIERIWYVAEAIKLEMIADIRAGMFVGCDEQELLDAMATKIITKRSKVGDLGLITTTNINYCEGVNI